jgi:hypothetical protein
MMLYYSSTEHVFFLIKPEMEPLKFNKGPIRLAKPHQNLLNCLYKAARKVSGVVEYLKYTRLYTQGRIKANSCPKQRPTLVHRQITLA